ncbi:hypothetical protein KAT92_00825, partial [Candidatus Babeliales bacterium]|nr:hypothetical protein [Candidatus Babeliales bacterium]
ELTEENNRLQGQINILNAQGDNLGATGNLRASSGNVAADASGVRIARLEAQLQELVDLIPVGMRVADAGGRVDLIASIRSILNQLRIVTDRNVFLNMRADALEAQLNAVREALRNFQEALPEGLRLNNIDKNLLDVLWLTLARFESLWRRAVAERELRNVSRRRSSFSSSRSEIREL